VRRVFAGLRVFTGERIRETLVAIGEHPNPEAGGDFRNGEAYQRRGDRKQEFAAGGDFLGGHGAVGSPE
jgi:hypothetical protein